MNSVNVNLCVMAVSILLKPVEQVNCPSLFKHDAKFEPVSKNKPKHLAS